jgi:hypothetical protein
MRNIKIPNVTPMRTSHGAALARSAEVGGRQRADGCSNANNATFHVWTIDEIVNCWIQTEPQPCFPECCLSRPVALYSPALEVRPDRHARRARLADHLTALGDYATAALGQGAIDRFSRWQFDA